MEFTYTIEKDILKLSEFRKKDGSVEFKALTLTSWNGKPALYDLRKWTIGTDGKRIPGKGITLNREQALEVATAIQQDANNSGGESDLPF